ncbi:MAG: ADP-ribosylglycohydrolase family protein [Opitutales bacterium]
MPAWTTPYHLLKEEFVQRADEGCDIPRELREDYAALDPDQPDRAAVERLYDALIALPEDETLAANEPNHLEAIRALRPEGPRDLHWSPDESELFDRLHGAWTGRCVGCALGKPVEHMGLGRDEKGRLNGRKNIRAYLEARNAWPLEDFFPGADAGDGRKLICAQSQREQIGFMESDDDLRYTCIGLRVVEDHGLDFTWREVARSWIHNLTVPQFCTAERQAVLNYFEAGRRGELDDPALQWIRRYRNPYREWIGAQIRSDGFAWAAAGKPELAAEFAHRDACWTHERNGIYGAMFCAALQAASFVETDPRRLVEIGLSEIPRKCRLAQAVRNCLEWVEFFDNWEACMGNVEKTFAHLHTVHTINNALICVLSLFYGQLDTTRTPAIAVACGLDTDCNGATVGGIAGAISGARAFGGRLAAKLNDTLKPEIHSLPETITLTELAKRHGKVWGAVDTLCRGPNL